MKRTSIKRKRKTEEEIVEERREQEQMWDFFEYMWSNLKVRSCWNCGTPIYGENLTIYWDHLLDKSKYESLKYEPGNIFFCCWDCHSSKGNGFPGEKHSSAIEEAKRKFL